MNRIQTAPALILLVLAPLSCSSSVDGPGDGLTSHPADKPMVWPAAQRPVGAPCAFDTQCETHRCSADVEAGACGECVTIEPLGGACSGPHQGCSISAACVAGLCQSLRKGEGEACKLGPKGYDIGDCDVDLFCEYAGSWDAGICLRRTPLGEGCVNPHGECVNGAYCDQTTGVCAPRDCLTGSYCGGNTVCGSDGLCHPGALPEGAECPIDGSDACEPGLVCLWVEHPDGATNRCSQRLGKGVPCSHYECAEGLFCYRPSAGGPGWCDSPRGEGEACSNYYYALNECAPGLECRGETCKAPCQ